MLSQRGKASSEIVVGNAAGGIALARLFQCGDCLLDLILSFEIQILGIDIIVQWRIEIEPTELPKNLPFELVGHGVLLLLLQ